MKGQTLWERHYVSQGTHPSIDKEWAGFSLVDGSHGLRGLTDFLLTHYMQTSIGFFNSILWKTFKELVDKKEFLN